MKNIGFLVISFLIVFSTSCMKIGFGLYTKTEAKHDLHKIEEPAILKSSKTPDAIPENIIFIISDGTGVGSYSLLYYSEPNFQMSRFEHVGLQATHPIGPRRVTDSAASGTALASGSKTKNRMIGMLPDSTHLKSSLAYAQEAGKATGVVATSTVSHATPASFSSHVPSRYSQDNIAMQMLANPINVIFGGGKKYFPEDSLQSFTANGGQFISSLETKIDSSKRILGLFYDDATPKHIEGRTPSTMEMTQKAIEILEQDDDGFFLMIEESQVDWAGHANSSEYQNSEMRSLNEVVEYCLDYQATHPETLVILTADHETGGVGVYDSEDSNALHIDFSSGHHSANFVPIFSVGPGANVFDAMLDNTEIGKIIISYLRK